MVYVLISTYYNLRYKYMKQDNRLITNDRIIEKNIENVSYLEYLDI